MADGDGVVLKVNRAPFQPQGFTSPQSVESAQEDRDLKASAFCSGKEFFNLVTIIEAANKAILPGPFHLVRRIRWDQVNFDGVFQRLMDVGMIVNDRIRRNPLQLLHIECLDVGRFQVTE